MVLLCQVDLTPPAMGAVYHGDRLAPVSNTSACGTSFKVTWDAAEDLETGVATYHISVGSSPGSDDVVANHLALGFDLPTSPGDPDVRPTAVIDAPHVPSGALYVCASAKSVRHLGAERPFYNRSRAPVQVLR